MTVLACPRCGDRYVVTALRCAACDVELVDVAGEGDGTDDEALAFDLSDWDDGQRAQLEDTLAAEGIAWAWEDGDLLVEEADEVRVEAVIEAIDFPDALPIDGSAPADDEADPELLSRLFVAADRLRGNPEHVAAIDEVLDARPGLASAPPYGIDPPTWAALGVALEELAAALEARAEIDAVEAAATQLRDLLRPLV